MNTAENTVLDTSFQASELQQNNRSESVSAIDSNTPNQSLRACVESTMENYFRHLDGQAVSDVYNMVLAEIEAPLLEVVMKNTRQNQTKASEILGLNRGTLRKKLKQYGLL
ncbi:MAG: Fis family transcriptional regulator [Candidatus Endobugula sp.]|jgi:Fis family transcriptional regulator